ncbi:MULTISPECIES: cell division topological specificity factor MinE [Dictyoglomus]|jgi:cell division topological specificity factor|uniref:Cell division topological specificity factor n=1 Tax=Dictyoglomus turgidum (strain DSM 6724 / Z-1310) TaxID=515635 RepID=B8E0T5_DICTD|nr:MULTISPECIES: cell division topological specificity factor MinE [Dictyoglomus]ACK42672.1 cell division topological specificity factor MinE [Dictyoglomus turgidum DSM 6724]PNV78798.1 MAG: cell division topological specificity factor MinE [Dictyoglomus turgidum]HBU30731.1 cell division topological specificity factor MinE [Dictyoglomus sp.]
MLLNTIWGRKITSKDVAKERLQVVLVYDRAKIEPQLVEKLKEDLVNTVSKYLTFDSNNIKIELSSEDNKSILRIDIPLKD